MKKKQKKKKKHFLCGSAFGVRGVDVGLPGNGNSDSHGARSVHLIITMIKWIRISRLSIKNSFLFAGGQGRVAGRVRVGEAIWEDS